MGVTTSKPTTDSGHGLHFAIDDSSKLTTKSPSNIQAANVKLIWTQGYQQYPAQQASTKTKRNRYSKESSLYDRRQFDSKYHPRNPLLQPNLLDTTRVAEGAVHGKQMFKLPTASKSTKKHSHREMRQLPTPPSSESESEPTARSTGRPLTIQSNQRDRTSWGPNTTYADFLDEPMSSICMALTQCQAIHLHHFFTMVLPSCKTIQACLWPTYHLSLNDEGPLTAILAKSMLHRWMNKKQSSWDTSVQLSAECLQLRTTALQYVGNSTRIISRRLSGPQATSNAVLLAVVELVCCYTSAFVSNEVVNHIAGLMQLVRLRGGLKQIPTFLAYRSIMADNVVAAMIGGKPQLEQLSDDILDEPILANLSSPSQKQIRATFSVLHRSFKSECFTSHLGIHVLLIERRLLNELYSLQTDLEPVDSVQCCPIIAQAIRLAFVIYIELNIARTWRFSAVLGALVARLKFLLEKTKLGFLWMPYTDALLLVVMLGGIGAIGHPQREWYVETLRLLASSLNLQNFHDSMHIMGIFDDLVGDTAEMMEVLWSEATC